MVQCIPYKKDLNTTGLQDFSCNSKRLKNIAKHNLEKDAGKIFLKYVPSGQHWANKVHCIIRSVLLFFN